MDKTIIVIQNGIVVYITPSDREYLILDLDDDIHPLDHNMHEILTTLGLPTDWIKTKEEYESDMQLMYEHADKLVQIIEDNL